LAVGLVLVWSSAFPCPAKARGATLEGGLKPRQRGTPNVRISKSGITDCKGGWSRYHAANQQQTITNQESHNTV
jgi:hypothetical protein